MSGVRLREDGSLYIVLPKILTDELSAIALFEDITLLALVKRLVKVGILLAKHDDIVLCRRDGGEYTGSYEEIDIDKEGL